MNASVDASRAEITGDSDAISMDPPAVAIEPAIIRVKLKATPKPPLQNPLLSPLASLLQQVRRWVIILLPQNT